MTTKEGQEFLERELEMTREELNEKETLLADKTENLEKLAAEQTKLRLGRPPFKT